MSSYGQDYGGYRENYGQEPSSNYQQRLPALPRQQSYPEDRNNLYDSTTSNNALYPPSQPYDYSASKDYLADDGAAPLSYAAAPLGRHSGGSGYAGYGNTGDGADGGRGGNYGGYGSREKTYPMGTQDGATKGSGRKKWWIIGAIVLLLAGAGAGIAVWRVKASQSSSSQSASGTTSANGPKATGTKRQAIPGTAGVVLSNPSDPSDFQKDPRLHVSFYGFSYVPKGAQVPECGATQANVTEDIQLISQLTTRLRMYGSSCNQSQLVLQAIQETKVNVTVWLGLYIGTDETVNQEQMTQTLAAISAYGTKHVSGVIVGNEYILNSANNATATTYIIAQMARFRTQLAALKLPVTIPVGTSDAGSEVSTRLAVGSDFIMANVHPFFGGLPIAMAAGWTWEFFQGNDVYYTDRAANKPKVYIGETGWPSASMTPANLTIGGATAGIPQLQQYLDTFPCTANANNTAYFFFEPFDEPWKEVFGGVEPYWGMFSSGKVLKDITMPTCVSP